MNALITLSVLAILVLYLGLFKAKNALLPVTLLGLVLSLVFSVMEWNTDAQPIYSGMMQFDNFAIAFASICILSTILILIPSRGYFENISQNVAEYYTLILFSIIGILVMVSFHNLSMLFIGIEIMSISLYILAGIRKEDFKSNEASLKYFLMGSFSTGFLLFGITLLYGATASFDLSEIGAYVINNPAGISPLFYTGIVFLTVGLAFKVGAAPFHFWVPDVYDGSPALITVFMSTVVKIASFAAFLRLFIMCFAPLHDFWIPVITLMSVITLFVGNITALYQSSFKRMLAYSSISHVGYMLFAIVALGAGSVNSIVVYAIAYSIATVVAFAVAILVKRQTASDHFDSFNGLARSNPFIAFTLTIAMLSLAGIPFTAGFIGKFMMFSTVLSEYHIWLVIFAVINAVIGICYYFKVIIAMYFRDGERARLQSSSYLNLVLGISAVITVLIGVYPALISDLF